MDDAPILLSRYFEVTQCSDTFTKSNGAKVSQYNCAQLWSILYLLIERLIRQLITLYDPAHYGYRFSGKVTWFSIKIMLRIPIKIAISECLYVYSKKLPNLKTLTLQILTVLLEIKTMVEWHLQYQQFTAIFIILCWLGQF